MGWATIVNGRLLALAAEQFDVFVAVEARRVRTNRLADLQPLVTKLLAAVDIAPSGVATNVEAD